MANNKSKPTEIKPSSQPTYASKGEGRVQGWEFSASQTDTTTFFSTGPKRDRNPLKGMVEIEKEKVPNPRM